MEWVREQDGKEGSSWEKRRQGAACKVVEWNKGGRRVKRRWEQGGKL